MIEKIKAYVGKYHMLEKGDIVLAGVSGGADSICLLFVLLKLQKEIPFALRVVHVNHGLRGAQAKRDEEYVAKVCRQENIPCKVFCENVELIAKKRRQSIEEAGREVRRSCFEQAASEWGAGKIALAHHMEDNAETLLMHLVRGSALKGLGGIYPVTGKYIRPLLGVGRKEIEQYLEQRNIAFCQDDTNEETIYIRNKIRHKVLPVLQNEINGKSVLHMNQAMDELREVQAYMETQVEMLYQRAVQMNGDAFLVKEDEMRKEPDVLKRMLLHRVLTQAADASKDIGRVHVENCISLFDRQVGKEVILPYGLLARKGYEGIRIIGKVEKEPTGTQMSAEKEAISFKIIENMSESPVIPQKTYTKWFDYDIIKDTVEIRTRRPGDYLVIDEKGNRQKLKSYFINEKIPKEKRDSILLAADGSHVLWVIGYRMSSAAKIQRNTKRILEIQINGGENDGRDN